MKEIAGMSMNFSLVHDIDCSPTSARAELIVLLSEPKWSCDHIGAFSKARVITETRFSVGLSAIRSMIASLKECEKSLAIIQATVKTESAGEDVDLPEVP